MRLEIGRDHDLRLGRVHHREALAFDPHFRPEALGGRQFGFRRDAQVAGTRSQAALEIQLPARIAARRELDVAKLESGLRKVHSAFTEHHLPLDVRLPELASGIDGDGDAAGEAVHLGREKRQRTEVGEVEGDLSGQRLRGECVRESLRDG